MRQWVRARGDEHCGKCGLPIASGEWLLVFARRGQRWRLVRCIGCAGEPVPDYRSELEPATARPEAAV